MLFHTKISQIIVSVYLSIWIREGTCESTFVSVIGLSVLLLIGDWQINVAESLLLGLTSEYNNYSFGLCTEPVFFSIISSPDLSYATTYAHTAT